ncbi:hypothetical protein ACE6H2_020857 [Prunus campanulata]
MDMNFEGGSVVLARLTSAQSVGELKSVKGGGRLHQLHRGEIGGGERDCRAISRLTSSNVLD